MVAGLTVARMVQVAIFKKIKPETVLPYSLALTAIGFCFLMFSPGFARAAVGMVLVGMGPVSYTHLPPKYCFTCGMG